MLPQTHILGRLDEIENAPEPTHAEATVSNTPSASDTDRAGTAEVGGRDGPEPTRFGDWEKNGRCIDF
jgi:hypothetical protein